MAEPALGPVLPPSASDRILLDACCLLNLYATRRCEEILRVIGARFAVADLVAGEAIYVFRGGAGPDARERDQIDLRALSDAGMLEILHLQSVDETANFVNFAAELDDGEAMTCALAVLRGMSVATDDRKALRILKERAPQVTIYTTCHLLQYWATSGAATAPDVRQALLDIQERGHYAPPKDHPLLSWWQSMIQQGERL